MFWCLPISVQFLCRIDKVLIFWEISFSFGDWIFTLLLKVIQQPVPALHHTIMQSLTSLINALFPKIPCGDVQQIIDASGDHFHQSHIESFE